MLAKMQPGTYYIGDPCYVIDDDKWDEFLEPYWNGEGEFEFEGHRVFAASTAFGDGTYYDNEGHKYGVDAGMIGAIPIELCVKRLREEFDRLGRVIVMTGVWEADRTEDGTFCFGDIEIGTAFSPSEEDYYDPPY